LLGLIAAALASPVEAIPACLKPPGAKKKADEW
jgi:hypothetical protein